MILLEIKSILLSKNNFNKLKQYSNARTISKKNNMLKICIGITFHQDRIFSIVSYNFLKTKNTVLS